MIKLILKYSFSRAQVPKKLIFQNKIGETIQFQRTSPIKNQAQRAMDFNQEMQIQERMQLLFQKFKSEKQFNEKSFEIINTAKEMFLKSNVSQTDFHKLVATKFYFEDHPKYFYFYCQLIEEYLNRYERFEQKQIRDIFHAMSGGMFFVEDQIFYQNKLNIYNQEEEKYILQVYEKLCDKIIVDLVKDIDLINICQIMKYIKRYNMNMLDQINQQLLLLADNYKLKLKQRVYFILLLVKAGISYFPEIIYKLRDEVLDSEQLQDQESKILFQQFEIFGRCNRVTLCQLASAKLYDVITKSKAIDKLNMGQRILLLYYASKSNVISYDLLLPFIEKIFSHVNVINEVNLKIVLLTLYNLNYKNLPNLKQLGQAKQRFIQIRNKGKFNESELTYIDDLINCI